MIAARKSRRDSSGLAVIRKYEPTRIERELLARVFDVVTCGVNVHWSESDDEKAMTVGDGGRVDGGRSCDGVESNRMTSTLEQRERAA